MAEYNLSLTETEQLEVAKQYQFITEEQQKTWFQVYKEVQEVLTPLYYYKKKKDLVLLAFTLGGPLDKLIDAYYKEEEILKAYAADCLAMSILMKFYQVAQREIEEKEQCCFNRFLFLEEEQSLPRIKEILEQLSAKEITCNSSYMLLPKKSVVMEATLGMECHMDLHKVCQSCTKKNCVNRKDSLVIRT